MKSIQILAVLICIPFSLSYAQTTITIDLPNYQPRSIYDATQIFDLVQYLILETNENCLIEEVGKIVKTETSILVLNNIGSSSSILQFSLETGKFINTIGRMGQGPGEYKNISDFDFYDQIIYLLDGYGQRILKYDLSGKFLGKIDDPFMSRGIGVLDNENIYLCLTPMGYLDHEPHSVALISSVGKIKDMLLPLSKNFIEIATEYPFIRIEDGLLFSRGLDNSVYLLNKDGAQLKWIIDFGKDNYLIKGKDYQFDKKTGQTRKSWIDDGCESNKPFYTRYFYSDGDVLFFYFTWSDRIYTSYVNLDSQSHIFGNWIDDNGYQELQGSRIVGSNVNTLIRASHMPYFVKNYSERFAKGGKEFLSVPINKQSTDLSSVQEDSNPVIFFVTLKSN